MEQQCPPQLDELTLNQFPNMPLPTTSDKLAEMRQIGAEWWNDSCDPAHLAEAVAHGATGATSNPVIVEATVSANQELWLPVVRQLSQTHPDDSSEAITWKLIAEMGRQAAEILRPVYEASNGARGYLSLQVNPEYNLDTDRMIAQAQELAALAPNIAIKLPTTECGLKAAEELIARGISVNTTVSFAVAQAVAAAEAIERGLDRYTAAGHDASRLFPYVTIMVGRVGDSLKRTGTARGVQDRDEDALFRSGTLVFKNAAQLFQARGYRSTLLAAAYRHEVQWSEIIGPNVLQSIPYAWWNAFRTSQATVRKSVEEPIDESEVNALRETFPEFDQFYLPDGLAIEEFQTFEASAATLDQFVGGYQALVKLVAVTMAPDADSSSN